MLPGLSRFVWADASPVCVFGQPPAAGPRFSLDCRIQVGGKIAEVFFKAHPNPFSTSTWTDIGWCDSYFSPGLMPFLLIKAGWILSLKSDLCCALEGRRSIFQGLLCFMRLWSCGTLCAIRPWMRDGHKSLFHRKPQNWDTMEQFKGCERGFLNKAHPTGGKISWWDMDTGPAAIPKSAESHFPGFQNSTLFKPTGSCSQKIGRSPFVPESSFLKCILSQIRCFDEEL